MDHPFLKKHNSAIGYSEFSEFGWTFSDYLAYCEIVSNLRASLIAFDGKTDADPERATLLEKQNSLLDWVGKACGCTIQLDYDLLYALSRRIRYIEHTEQTGVGVLPFLYRSESDFRFEFEKHLPSVLSNHPLEAKAFYPYCSNRTHAVSLQKSLLEQKEQLISALEMEPPCDGGEASLYEWARKKEDALIQIDNLTDRINVLQWRIEEFDEGGEFDASKHTLFVYKGFIKCQRDDHPITCVNAKIRTKNGRYIYLNVNYCKLCKQFYISYSEYQNYRARYGILIAKIVMTSNGEFTHDIDYLASESPLKLCGYSVAQSEGLTTQMRQDLLRELIQLKIISKPETVRYLSWFIQMNGQRFGNEIARKKWEEDLDFVRELDTKTQSTHFISEIKPYPGYNKL